MAVMHARGQVQPGEHFVHRSILDTKFDGVIERLTTVGGVDAVVPSIAGQAWITDFSKVGVDPSDPFPTGFTLTDTWLGPNQTKASLD
jgi:proline racemase